MKRQEKSLQLPRIRKLLTDNKLLTATTSINANALRASYLVANSIAKAKKLFTAGEELILIFAVKFEEKLLLKR